MGNSQMEKSIGFVEISGNFILKNRKFKLF